MNDGTSQSRRYPIATRVISGSIRLELSSRIPALLRRYSSVCRKMLGCSSSRFSWNKPWSDNATTYVLRQFYYVAVLVDQSVNIVYHISPILRRACGLSAGWSTLIWCTSRQEERALGSCQIQQWLYTCTSVAPESDCVIHETVGK